VSDITRRWIRAVAGLIFAALIHANNGGSASGIVCRSRAAGSRSEHIIEDCELSKKNVFIFCLGRELLEGTVLDRNGNFMAKSIDKLAFRVQTIQVLDQVEEEMVAAFRSAMAQKPGYIITTGGMGPGHDDLTRQAVAAAANLPLVHDERAGEFLTKSYKRLAARNIVENAELNEDRLIMAKVPEGSICYENPIGTAPAVRLRVAESTFFLLPGVPEEMQRMFDLYIIPALAADGPGIVKKARHVEWPGGDESALKRILTDINRRFPEIHTRARVMGHDDNISLRVSLFGEHSDEEELDKVLGRAEADLRARLGLEITNRPDSATSAE
jgi:molybdenum cofactor synthesis domain-containing protein